MKKPKEKSKAQDFADTIKDNPKEIIAWAKREIKCYNELIKILTKKI
jgi:hypothetical protein